MQEMFEEMLLKRIAEGEEDVKEGSQLFRVELSRDELDKVKEAKQLSEEFRVLSTFFTNVTLLRLQKKIES